LGGIANTRLDLFGADLHEFMKRAKRGLTRIGTFGEELPNIENRIELVIAQGAIDSKKKERLLARIIRRIC
jgi:hypothetical protein